MFAKQEPALTRIIADHVAAGLCGCTEFEMVSTEILYGARRSGSEEDQLRHEINYTLPSGRQEAPSLFLDRDQNILVLAIALQHGHRRPYAPFRIDLEKARFGQPLL